MIYRRDFIKTTACATAAGLIFPKSSLCIEAPGTPAGHEFHVSVYGNDKSDGSQSSMLRSIAAAADRAQPGDVITVHKGIYRERVDPPRGGSSNESQIIYRAAPGERVEITGAEIVKGWAKIHNDVWNVSIPNSFFGKFNPYNDLIRGDWFYPKGRQHHTGAVYLNGDWLVEAASLDDVLNKIDSTPLWFGRVDEKQTTLWAQFRGVDPNQELTEINVRRSVFYPSNPGMNYITVKGFILRRAATPWAPPTAEQIGVIGTHWSKCWVIENNVVSHSTCSGISLGKHGDEFDNTSQDSAEGYVKTIERALKRGWCKENIGSHLVRGNQVSHCEQAGIVGSLGCSFSRVMGNTVHDIHRRKLFYGEEMAGIKFHGAIDTEISHNHIYQTYRGMWMDWLAQGTHIHHNVCHQNETMDVFMEVDHGPFLIENNVFLSSTSQLINSQGGAYAHNLFCGEISLVQHEDRLTPYLKAHSTQIAELHGNPTGDMRFYNNLFAQNGDLSSFNVSNLPMYLSGNVFLQDARPCIQEAAPSVKSEFDPKIAIVRSVAGLQLEITLDPAWSKEQIRMLVTSEMLGVAEIPKLPFQLENGLRICIDIDFSGQKRNSRNPFPGPFEISGSKPGRIHVMLAPLPAS